MNDELKMFGGWIVGIIAGLAVLIFLFGGHYTVEPSQRGIKVTMGHMDTQFISPGFGFKWPLITDVTTVSVQQQTEEIAAPCFSSDMQNISIKIKVLYRVPESSVVSIVRDYNGEPFPTLIAPRVQEATKEATALRTAADIVKGREAIKAAALSAARTKIGTILEIDDIVIEDIALSPELEQAITAKMVSQQEAEKAVFKKQQAQTDAETAIIAAQAQAQAMKIQADALNSNQNLVQWEIAKKWDGHSPQVVGVGVNPIMPLPSLNK